MRHRSTTAVLITAFMAVGGAYCGGTGTSSDRGSHPPGSAAAPEPGNALLSLKPGDAVPTPKPPEPKPSDTSPKPETPGADTPKTAPGSPAAPGKATDVGKAAPSDAAANAAAGSSKSGLAAPLPKPAIKTHFNKGAGKYVFKDRTWDLAQIKKAFNTVIVSYDDHQLISDIREAGLAAILEFDAKDDPTGKKAQAAVAAITRQVKLNPGTIAGIRVADRLNEKLTTERGIEYLRLTGGAFHREIPGVPVIVDVEDWELTCGLPGQGSCVTHKFTAYSNCVDAALVEIYKSGYVDGFELSVNLKNDDSDAMEKAMTKARKMFPPPFLLYARTASLSFDEENYPGDAAAARKQVAAYIETPLRVGADGIDLWAWHRPWKTELRTFLNKGGGSNPLWEDMMGAYAKVSSPKP